MREEEFRKKVIWFTFAFSILVVWAHSFNAELFMGTAKEGDRLYEVGAKEVLAKLLPVVDNFERGLDALSEEEKEGAFAQGFIKIYQQMITVLEEIGVKPMDAVGKEFNPDFHNAVMHEENEEMGENLVSEEFQKGYMYKDGVLRHSMVKVVN